MCVVVCVCVCVKFGGSKALESGGGALVRTKREVIKDATGREGGCTGVKAGKVRYRTGIGPRYSMVQDAWDDDVLRS